MLAHSLSISFFHRIKLVVDLTTRISANTLNSREAIVSLSGVFECISDNKIVKVIVSEVVCIRESLKC